MFYSNYVKLCSKLNKSPSAVGEELGFTRASVTGWGNGATPRKSSLIKIADYFGVTVDYLMTGKEEIKETAPELTERDERDISKDIERIMSKLSAGEDGPASYDGQELDPEAAELFRDELEISLRRLKIINKEKYTPKKYKK